MSESEGTAITSRLRLVPIGSGNARDYYWLALEQLRGASEDAALLCATSRTALGVVREVLSVLVAAVDCRRAA